MVTVLVRKHRDTDMVSLITHHKLKLPHGYMNYPKMHQVERQTWC